MKVKLNEVSSGFTKNIAQKDLENNNGCYPIYGASGYIKDIDFYISDKPYIGIVKDGSGVGRADLYPAYSSLLGTMQYILPNENMDISYLMYALRYMKLGSLYSGAAIPHIYYKNYQRNELNYREIDEQKVISTQLTQIEKAIEVCNAKLSMLDELVKSRFIEMFGNQEFPIISLDSIAEVTGGLTKNGKRKDMPMKYPYLRVANVYYNRLDLSEILEIGVKDNAEVEKALLKTDDLLFVEGNGSPAQIGRVALWNGSIEHCLHQNHLIKARLDLSKVNPRYVLFYFMSEDGREQIANRAVSTSGLYTLSVSKVAGLVLPIPQIELQNEFSEFVKLTDKSKFIVQKQIEDLQELLDSKMDEYFG